MPHQKIQQSIKIYAAAYAELQHLQDTHHSIPGGDQKTGCIGEYYAYLYLRMLYGEESLRYGSHSEKGWDIEVAANPAFRVQVKAVSAFSKTRTISPIHKGWDQLFIVFLSKNLIPEGFWIIEDKSIFGQKEMLTSLKCRIPNKPLTGSACIPFGQNKIIELNTAIAQASF